MNELTWRERGRLWLRLTIRAVILLLFFFAITSFGPYAISLMMPFVLALFMAWLLNPLVRLLQKKLKLGRNVVTLLLILLFFVVVGGGLFFFLTSVVREFATILSDWPSIWQQLQLELNQVAASLTELFELLPDEISAEASVLINNFLGWLQSRIPNMVTALGGFVLPVATSLPSAVVAAVVFVMAAYFMTADYPRLRFLLADHVPQEFRGFWSKVKGAAVSALGGYLRAQLILSLAVFFILLIGFVLLGQTYALILSLVFAVMDFIPIIGAGTAMVPWAVVGVLTGDYRHAVGLLVIWGVIVIFRRIAEPKVVGNQTGLSPILSLVSIYAGMKLGGVAGMVLGPVLTMVLLSLIRDGVFAGLVGDAGLAVHDLSAVLKNRPKGPREDETP